MNIYYHSFLSEHLTSNQVRIIRINENVFGIIIKIKRLLGNIQVKKVITLII